MYLIHSLCRRISVLTNLSERQGTFNTRTCIWTFTSSVRGYTIRNKLSLLFLFSVMAMPHTASQKRHKTKRSVRLLYRTLKKSHGCPKEWVMCYTKCITMGFNFASCFMSKNKAECKCVTKKDFAHIHTPCIPLMQLNMLRHRLMQHFTRLVRNVKR